MLKTVLDTQVILRGATSARLTVTARIYYRAGNRPVNHTYTPPPQWGKMLAMTSSSEVDHGECGGFSYPCGCRASDAVDDVTPGLLAGTH